MRKEYKREFKEMLVSLLNGGQSSKQVSAEYGIHVSVLNRWRREYNDASRPSFTGKGNVRLSTKERELLDLKKRLKDVTIERDILKKAVSIFSVSDR